MTPPQAAGYHGYIFFRRKRRGIYPLVIKSTALELFPGCKVILFGSRARHVHNTDSDYDILVVIDKTLSSEEKMPFRTQIRKTLLTYGILSDILIQSEQEVNQKRQLTGHIVKTIIREGVAI